MVQDLVDSHNAVIDLAETADFMLGRVLVRPAMRDIVRDNYRCELQPRVMQVLIALAQAQPNVVSRDRLIARCWGGRIVGDDALNRCIVVLRTIARDLDDEFGIHNVARVGYRLALSSGAPSERRPSTRRWRRVAIAGTIGMAVATAGIFGARLIHDIPGRASGFVGNPNAAEAHRLYLAGQALLRTDNPQVAGDARILFRQAVAIDPNHALAWTGLAEALCLEASLQGPERVIAVLPEARANIRRALTLSPDLAAAHEAMGAVLGFTSTQALQHLFRAAALEPDTAQGQVALANARRATGDFSGEIASYRRAYAIDPAWYLPLRDLAVATAEMGDRTIATRMALRTKRAVAGCAGTPARVDWIYGDIAESARCSVDAAKAGNIWSAPARVVLASARLTLGLTKDGREATPLHIVDTRPPQGRIWLASAPTPTTWRQQNRNADAALIYRMQNLVGAKKMLNDGRQAELVATYDGPTGLLGIRGGAVIRAANLPAVAIVALALRRAGREKEAAALLDQATRVIDEADRRGPVPFTFDVTVAAVAAVAGDRDRAIARLRRARDRGWVNNAWSDLLALDEEPAFASVTGDSRFVAIVRELASLYARERQQMLDFRI